MAKTVNYLIIGLGNPGKEYAETFHNIGYMCADAAAKRLGGAFDKGECRAITAHVKLPSGVKIILAKPITFMNLSGAAAQELIHKYKIEKERFLVVYDDADLPLGALRVRKSGSAGTHNGMRDLVLKLGTQDFYRLRLGIKREFAGGLADFVLSKLTGADKAAMDKSTGAAASAILDFCAGASIDQIMQKYNTAGSPDPQSE